ncbi:hypothetical protein GGS21DRAFT_424475 [Xylaria nigripes]|nr:hypothetical protein GGS21DRAFT_424475 [Xylaria nigripes]
MEIPNYFSQCRQETNLSETGVASAYDTTAPGTRLPRRKPSLRTNFSYPSLSRQESCESRSSSGSLPGMTDASDSDDSVEDDIIDTISADEAWDSFWPDSITSLTYRQSQEQDLDLLRPGWCNDYPGIKTPPRRRQPTSTESDAMGIQFNECDPEGLTKPCHTIPLSPSQCTPKERTATHPICTKPPVAIAKRQPHPPRTSSLGFGSPPPPPPPPPTPPSSSLLRGSRSNSVLTSPKSPQILYIAPSLTPYDKPSPLQQRPTTKSASAPVSPAYPPPPPPRAIRPASSAFNLRNTTQMCGENKNGLVSHNVTAPLAPLLPSALPEPRPTRWPQPELCVSVFEYDSDSETEAEVEVRSFARRIARGLHRKSASEKRCSCERKALTTKLGANISDKSPEDKTRNEDSLRRRRGGSLGRIFGLKPKRCGC